MAKKLPKLSSWFFLRISIFLLFTLILAGCIDQKDKTNVSDKNPPSITNTNNQGMIEIVSHETGFEAPDEISSGWITFRYKNLTPEPHFFLLQKFPEGNPAASKIINSRNEQQDFAHAHMEKLPDWRRDMIMAGGSGLISPKKIAETTVNLDPGLYMMECYLKLSNGSLHSEMQTMRELRITESTTENQEPRSTKTINISSSGGIEYYGSIRPGKHVFAVQFLDQKIYENFMGHDVHLVRLKKDSDINELNSWMNWLKPSAFISPAPRGIEFLGGTQEIPKGNISYFSALLSPGDYAFISEVPNPKKKNMLKIFTVASHVPDSGKN